jgi:hypothetical protein
VSHMSVSRFLDLEAAVERGSEGSDYSDNPGRFSFDLTRRSMLIRLLDDFIDDNIETDETPSSSRSLGFWSLGDESPDESAVERFFAGTRRSLATLEETHQPEYPSDILLPHTIRPGDYPIWQVPCRVSRMTEYL